MSLKGSARPRLEPEIAFKLKAPLSAGVNDPRRFSSGSNALRRASRSWIAISSDWKFQPADSVADFALHWRLIVGSPCRPPTRAGLPALAEQIHDCSVALSRNGKVVGRGVGANALGHPAVALAHLADLLSRQAQFDPLAAGEVITTGTLTPAVPIHPGEAWTSCYDVPPGVSPGLRSPLPSESRRWGVTRHI